MHKSTHMDRRRELTLFDPESMRSLAQLLPEGMVHQIKYVYESDEYRTLLSLDERALCADLRRKGFDPGVRDYHLRYQFWQEYDSAQANENRVNPQINMSKVLRRTIPKESFYRDYITDHRKLVFLLTPPSEYRAEMEMVLYRSMDKMMDILDLPILNKNGTLATITVNKMISIQKILFAQLQFLTGKSPVMPGRVEKPLRKGETDEEGTSGPSLAAESLEDKMQRLLLEHQHLQEQKQHAGIGQEKPPRLEDV